jgi:protein-S-isoprenylcysteine O-methyltransferase Ste14
MADRPGVITLPPLIYAAFLVVGIYWRDVLPLSLGPGPLRKPIGVALVAAGILIAFWAMGTMTRARTTFNPFRPSSAIVSSGPFRFTRNPIYLGDLLIYAGVAMYFDSALALLLLPLVIVAMHFGVIVREERYLERKFGEEYRNYRQRVRRWL